MKDNLWINIQNEVELRIEAEPSLNSFLTNLVLNQESITSSLAAIIASKLHSDALSALDIKHFINDV
ncbi:MAG: serine O-acetyltransferase, partial [Alphaproteobacteria bacterium]|nr:serine O-acetyltransferase [Alphaproteobacteria bacterium]